MSVTYNYNRNPKFSPSRKSQTQRYKFEFVFYDDIESYRKKESSHKIEIEALNIPDACGIFHYSHKKLYPKYYINDIHISPIDN